MLIKRNLKVVLFSVFFTHVLFASSHATDEKRCVQSFETNKAFYNVDLTAYIKKFFPRQQEEYFKCIFSDIQMDLVFDPAKNKATVGSLKEALAGRVGGKLRIFETPLSRGPETIEFFDGAGHPWDVKAPVSPDFNPLIDDTFQFSSAQVLKSIRHKLAKTQANLITGKVESIRILFDISWLNEKDKTEMMAAMSELSRSESENVKVIDYSPDFASCVQ